LFGEPKIEKDDEKIEGISYLLTFSGDQPSGIYFDFVQEEVESYF
jgi:hypothetical protein